MLPVGRRCGQRWPARSRGRLPGAVEAGWSASCVGRYCAPPTRQPGKRQGSYRRTVRCKRGPFFGVAQ
jgi:hypothetical protein